MIADNLMAKYENLPSRENACFDNLTNLGLNCGIYPQEITVLYLNKIFISFLK
jgi:hypothetical protein